MREFYNQYPAENRCNTPTLQKSALGGKMHEVGRKECVCVCGERDRETGWERERKKKREERILPQEVVIRLKTYCTWHDIKD